MRRLAMVVFRRLPMGLRRRLVRLGTPSYTVGAVALLRRRDGAMLLVAQRHSGGWALPGGLLGRGEGAAAGLVRELREEVALEVEAGELPVPLAVVNPRARRVDLVFSFDLPESAAVRREDRDEVTGVGWFALDELPDVTEPTLDILRGVRVR